MGFGAHGIDGDGHGGTPLCIPCYIKCVAPVVVDLPIYVGDTKIAEGYSKHCFLHDTRPQCSHQHQAS